MLLHWLRHMFAFKMKQPAATGNIPLLGGAICAGQSSARRAAPLMGLAVWGAAVVICRLRCCSTARPLLLDLVGSPLLPAQALPACDLLPAHCSS